MRTRDILFVKTNRLLVDFPRFAGPLLSGTGFLLGLDIQKMELVGADLEIFEAFHGLICSFGCPVNRQTPTGIIGSGLFCA